MTESPIPPVTIFTEFNGALTDHSINQGVVIVFPAKKSGVLMYPLYQLKLNT